MKKRYTKLLLNLKNKTLNMEMEDWDIATGDVIER
jgi:hypothetical protein